MSDNKQVRGGKTHPTHSLCSYRARVMAIGVIVYMCGRGKEGASVDSVEGLRLHRCARVCVEVVSLLWIILSELG